MRIKNANEFSLSFRAWLKLVYTIILYKFILKIHYKNTYWILTEIILIR
jgi:hypothetical protein